jgi:hypothetical protein
MLMMRAGRGGGLQELRIHLLGERVELRGRLMPLNCVWLNVL